jgi:Asp-tRNA(Asn)/Glu-tRNA(Gln) amidotransferase C subunit
MVIMYKMTPEKREKYTKKIDKMMDFLDEFKECLESGVEDEEYSYRGGSYRREEEDPEYRGGRYGYRHGMR